MPKVGVPAKRSADGPTVQYVGTIVGESTCREFRLALAREAVREQDIIAVDAELRPTDGRAQGEKVRVWAKVQRIERVNPLFPHEAGHELAETQTHPLDTVLSLSREMVTAVCQVLGSEPPEGGSRGRLDHLRYPAQPATSAYRPTSADIARIVLGELQTKEDRALDLATLSNRPEIDVKVDGHAVVSRHLAILAMTGAGKSWTARRTIEELAKKHYPVVIFDPHGDYTGLADVPGLGKQVRRFYATFPVFDEDAETVASIVSTLGYELTHAMRGLFDEVFAFAKAFLVEDKDERRQRVEWLVDQLGSPYVTTGNVRPDMYLIGNLAEAAQLAVQREDEEAIQQLRDWGWTKVEKYTKTDAKTLEGMKKRCRTAAAALRRMEETNRRVAKKADPLPKDRTELVKYNQISVISLAGYTGDFQATIYSLIAEDVFEKKVSDELRLGVLFVLEEAHNFAPAEARTDAEKRSITTTRQIAQEGRKFGVGLVIISQRPSRLDETTLSQCNSFVIMRMVNPADQSFVRRVIETLGEDESKLLPDLDVGEALLSGQFINFPVLVRMKEPASKGEREEEDAFKQLEAAHRASAKP
jgi:DNA helicase HerA-like ATPase